MVLSELWETKLVPTGQLQFDRHEDRSERDKRLARHRGEEARAIRAMRFRRHAGQVWRSLRRWFGEQAGRLFWLRAAVFVIVLRLLARSRILHASIGLA